MTQMNITTKCYKNLQLYFYSFTLVYTWSANSAIPFSRLPAKSKVKPIKLIAECMRGRLLVCLTRSLSPQVDNPLKSVTYGQMLD